MAESSLDDSRAADWRALVAEALKGARFEQLRSTTYDGIVIEPLYARATSARVIPARAAGRAWTVMQRIDLPDPATANAQILDDLHNGASGLTLVFPGAIGDYGYALPPAGAAISEALDNVHLDAGIAVELDLSAQSKDAAGLLATLVKARGITAKDVTIRFGFGPLGGLAMSGSSPMPWNGIAPILAGLISDLAAQGYTGPFAVADGRPVHAAGGSESQELAFVLACALAYLRALEASGVALEDARRFIYFRLAADQDQFLTVAKFRAIRKLWAQIEQACGLKPRPAFVAAETAWRMMAKRDPHGNIVRTTIAALAAALGGADAVTVLPYTAALGLPDELARRIARNTQTILIEEANLHRVADPAAGSGAIEALTDALCAGGWKGFQEIERAGGAAEALKAGLIQRDVAKVRAMREANVAQRKEPLIGTSDFPDLVEEAVHVPQAPAATPDRATSPTISPLRRLRLAEPFERLRDASDAYLARHGTRPKVFLACLGRPADFNARASFAKSLFESGGIEAVTPEGPQTRDDMVKAFKASGAALTCLCSSDKVYAGEAAEAAKALIAAGAKHIYLAGKPGENQAALEAAGIGTFLYQGCDTLEVLQSAYERLDA